MTRRKVVGQVELFPEPEGVPRVRRVRRGVDATVGALRSGGRIEPVDAVLVALARTLGDAIDDERSDAEGSGFTVATLAGRLLPVVDALRGQAPALFDGLDELLAGMGAEVEPEPEPVE